MKETVNMESHKTIRFDGYTIVVFTEAVNQATVKKILTNPKFDAAVIATKSSIKGYVLHFISTKNVNVKRLVDILAKEGAGNGLYWRGESIPTMHSAKIFAANLNMFN